MSGDKKRSGLTVSIPGLNMDETFGPRSDGGNSSGASRTRSKLDKKREQLEAIELDKEITETEAELEEKKILLEKRRQGVEEEPKETMSEKLMDRVVIPMVNKKLSEEPAKVVEAVKVEQKDTVTDELIKKIVIPLVNKKLNEEPETRVEPDPLDSLDRTLATIERVEGLRERWAGADKAEKTERAVPTGKMDLDTARFLSDENRKDREFQRRVILEDRAFQLRQREIDKKHDAALADLGIKKERNEIFKDGLKKIGGAVIRGLEEEGEEIEPEAGSQHAGLISLKCPKCSSPITVPPESQVAGAKIKCANPKCKAELEFTAG